MKNDVERSKVRSQSISWWRTRPLQLESANGNKITHTSNKQRGNSIVINKNSHLHMWTCVWALDATIALALERWSFPSPRSRDLFEKVTTLSHIRTRVCVCVCGPARLQYRWAWSWWIGILKHTACACCFISSGERCRNYVIKRKRNVNQMKEKISSVTLWSRESPLPSSSPLLSSPKPSLSFFVFCCIADVVKGLHLKK